MVIYRDAEEKFIKRVEFYMPMQEDDQELAGYLYTDKDCTVKATRNDLLAAFGMVCIVVSTPIGEFHVWPSNLYDVYDEDTGRSMTALIGKIAFSSENEIHVMGYSAEFYIEPDDSEGT